MWWPIFFCCYRHWLSLSPPPPPPPTTSSSSRSTTWPRKCCTPCCRWRRRAGASSAPPATRWPSSSTSRSSTSKKKKETRLSFPEYLGFPPPSKNNKAALKRIYLVVFCWFSEAIAWGNQKFLKRLTFSSSLRCDLMKKLNEETKIVFLDITFSKVFKFTFGSPIFFACPLFLIFILPGFAVPKQITFFSFFCK